MDDIAAKIDHSVLNADARPVDVAAGVAAALEHGFASVCVAGRYVSDVARALSGSRVMTCAVVGFPMGNQKTSVKAIEATAAVKDGANEIDFVAHLPYLMQPDGAAAKSEFLEVAKAARAANPAVIIKVIIESALLLGGTASAEQGEARIAAACQAARESGCDFVKTSTGFHPAGGATVRAVSLMKKHSGGLYVKASGGIRSRADALAMLDAGADRLGCSAGVRIVGETSATPANH